MSSYTLQTTMEESVVLPVSITDRLLRAGNGDAALLYLAILRSHGNADAAALCAALRWQQERFDNAAQALTQLGLIRQMAQQTPAVATPPPQRTQQSENTWTRPEYSNADLIRALERAEFASLSAAVDQALGKKLTTPDQKILLGLYDDLGLGADVIFLLVNFCLERSAKRYGTGHRPTMRQIEQEGYAWARMELLDQERASAYIKKYNRRQEALPRMMRLLGLGDRKPSTSEERYMSAWCEMGFEDAAIELAYDKTILKCKELKWPYMNKILAAWNEKGLHTVKAIEAGDQSVTAQNAQSTGADDAAAQREDLERMEKYLQQLRQQRDEEGT